MQFVKAIVRFLKNGGSEVKAPGVNFIEGTNITLTIAENTTENVADVTIDAAAGGGADFLSGYERIISSETITIPVRKQMVVDELLLEGDLIIEGSLVIV